ncbi:hypothetical protein GCM10020001_064350 [Nonomuraea salmonea]
MRTAPTTGTSRAATAASASCGPCTGTLPVPRPSWTAIAMGSPCRVPAMSAMPSGTCDGGNPRPRRASMYGLTTIFLPGSASATTACWAAYREMIGSRSDRARAASSNDWYTPPNAAPNRVR